MREPQRRLGRGLAALMDGDGASDAGDLRLLPIDALAPNPFQPRAAIDPASLADLASSIAQHGVLQAILVRSTAEEGRYQIVAGERRWRAAKLAGLAEMPCTVRPLSDHETSAAALVENLQRHDLNALEEAEGMNRMVEDFGLTHEALARAVGKSRSHVANTIRLLKLPRDVQQDVRSGHLSAGHARALLAHPDPAGAARAVIARGLNVRQTEALAAAAATPAREAAKPAPRGRDPDIAALERDLSERLGLRVAIAARGAAGSVTLHYQSLDQLDGLVTLLSRA